MLELVTRPRTEKEVRDFTTALFLECSNQPYTQEDFEELNTLCERVNSEEKEIKKFEQEKQAELLKHAAREHPDYGVMLSSEPFRGTWRSFTDDIPERLFYFDLDSVHPHDRKHIPSNANGLAVVYYGADFMVINGYQYFIKRYLSALFKYWAHCDYESVLVEVRKLRVPDEHSPKRYVSLIDPGFGNVLCGEFL